MAELRDLLAQVIADINDTWDKEALANLTDETNIFAAIDSLAILQLLLETEAAVEKLARFPVPLGTDLLVDQQHSPLLKFSTWVRYVESTIDAAGKRSGA